MKLKELYDEGFLKTFGPFKEKIGNIYMDEKQHSIPVKEIIDILGYHLESTYDSSRLGECNDETKAIYINPLSKKGIQNFYIAHAIGHIVLQHNKKKEEILKWNNTSQNDK